MTATQVASLYGVLGLDDKDFQRGMKNADTLMGKVSGGLESVSDSLFKLGAKFSVISDPIRDFGMQGIQVAADFESSLAEISARAGITGKDLADLSATALQWGQDSAFSGQQALDAFLQLTTSGLTLQDAYAIMPEILDGASAAGQDLGTTADMVTNIMAQFGLEIKTFEDGTTTAGHVIEQLVRAAGASSATVDELSAGFSNVGPVAAQFGMNISETAATLAIFRDNGIGGAEAGTQLKSMLLNMVRPTDDVEGAWKRLGTSFYDAEGNARPLEEVIFDLDKALDKLPVEEQNELMHTLAGSYGIVGLTALRGGTSIGEMQQRMMDAAGSAKVAETRMDTWNGKVDSLMGSIEALQVNALLPLMQKALQPLIEDITKVVNSISDWVVANPEAANTIVMILGAVAFLSPILLGLGAIFGVVSAAVGVLSGALALLFSPIGLLIAAAFAIGYAYHTNFGGIKDFIDGEVLPRLQEFFGFLGDVWEQVKPALTEIATWFTQTALPAIAAFIQNEILPVVTDFFNFIEDVWNLVQPGLQAFFEWFNTTGLPVIKAVVETVWHDVIEPFFNIIKDVWETVGPALGDVFNWFVTNGLPVIRQVVEDIWHNVFEPFINVLKGIWEAVRPGFEAFGNGVRAILGPIIQLIQGILDRLGQIRGEQVLGNTGTGDFAGIEAGAPNRDSGGMGIAGQPYLIGAGAQPELFVPKSAGTFYPNADQMGSGGTQIQSLTIIANSAGEGRAAADGFKARMDELERQRGV